MAASTKRWKKPTTPSSASLRASSPTTKRCGRISSAPSAPASSTGTGRPMARRRARRAAARQGLRRMKQLADLGFHQGVLPPQERPSMRLLRELGFSGDEATVIARVAKNAPELLAAASSASAMWTANAATVSPSADTHDGRVHFTPANLCSKLHRAIEHESTRRTLRAIFADNARFAVHEALPGTPALGDEGAANHTRFCAEYGARGVEFFLYGRSDYRRGPAPKP